MLNQTDWVPRVNTEERFFQDHWTLVTHYTDSQSTQPNGGWSPEPCDCPLPGGTRAGLRMFSWRGGNWNCQAFLGRNPWATYLPIQLTKSLLEQQLGRMLAYRVDTLAFSKKIIFFTLLMSKAEETMVLVYKWEHSESLWEDVSWHRRMGWGCISNSVELSCWQGSLKTLEWTWSQTLGRADKED